MTKPAAIDLNTVVVQSGDLLTSELDGETVLMSLRRSAYYGVDATAQHIWQRIASPCRVEDLCQQLIAEYAVEPQTCQRQVCAFLEELSREGLVQVVADAGS